MKTKLKSHIETDEIERISIQRDELMNEIDLIDNVYRTILKNGFTFSRQQVTNYYLSLKTKPFVILTGISGTGKTKITELLAEAVCEDKKQYKCLPVRPDWNDDKSLLGYYNPLTKKYQSTDFLNFVMQAGKESENPYFVCLDEMNLARVEYYFSTFLSAMESKNEITLHSEKTNIQTDSGEEIPGKIKIPPNLFFTGTVNMDETTYRFSPKVLDRANTIEFIEIYLLRQRENNNPTSNIPDISNLFKENFLKDVVGIKEKGTDEYQKYQEWEKENWNLFVGLLEDINKIFKEYNLHFGYRIRDEILRYLYFAEKLGSSDFNTDTAMDFQIKQKILPRIKGPESIKPALESLRDKFAGKYPISSAKINQMLKALQNGYTDFYQ